MSDRWTRVAIVGLAAVAIVVFLIVALLMVASGITCEDAEDAAFDTVRCDSERGAGWRSLQSVLLYLGGGGLFVGTVLSLARPRWEPVLIAIGAAFVVLFVAGQIGGIELGDKRVPRVTEVRLLDSACRVPCADGIRVEVTVDSPAELELRFDPVPFDESDRQYRSTVDRGADDTVAVDKGTHELRVTGAIVNPPRLRGPLPAGSYDVEVTARPQDAGNQRDAAREPVERAVTINP